MKRCLLALGVLIGCASAFGLTYAQLLSENDLEFQRIDNASAVALGSELTSEHQWGSYNQWQCFNMSQIELTCADYDHGTLVPSIRVATEREIFLFDVHVEDRLDCEQTLSAWRKLLVGGIEACIFAAHMPDIDLDLDGELPQSLWYINRLKGVGGYWNLFEESPQFRGH